MNSTPSGGNGQNGLAKIPQILATVSGKCHLISPALWQQMFLSMVELSFSAPLKKRSTMNI